MTYSLAPPLPPTDTRDDYSRIHFDPSGLPAKRIVGILACQRDPLLRQLTSTVHSCVQAAAPPVAQKGRQKKKSGTNTPSGTDTPSTPTGSLWEVQLEDTVVFPEGGGQPWDTGTMSVTDGNGEVHDFPIEGCVRRGLDAVHLVRVKGSPIDFSTLPGQEVTVTVDWERRMDHMVTHTAQHLLSAVLDTRNLPTLSWAMDPYPTEGASYIELPRGLTWQEAEEVERECNAYIGENLKVWIDVNVQQEGVEPSSEVEREMRVIPKDYTGGVIRHCNIDGVDRNACCGTQCPHLSLIQFLHVLPPSTPWDATTPSSSTPTRLYFVAGSRAMRHLASASRSLSRAGQAISVSRELVVERVTRLEANRFDTANKEKALRVELARTLGAEAATPGQPGEFETLNGVNGISPPFFAPRGTSAIAYIHRTASATHDYEFMNAVAGAFFDTLSQKEVNDGTEADASATIVLTSAPTNTEPALLLIQSRDVQRAKDLFDQLKKEISQDNMPTRLKGGGAKGRFMGKLDGWNTRDTLLLKELFKL